MDPLTKPSRPGSPAAASGGTPSPGDSAESPGPAPAPPNFVLVIWEKYRSHILHQVDVVEDAVVALLESRLTDPSRREACREAHKLAGSVRTFGFQYGSDWAREIEIVLGDEIPLTPAHAYRLSELVLAIRDELERPQGAPAPVGTPVPAGTPAPAPPPARLETPAPAPPPARLETPAPSPPTARLETPAPAGSPARMAGPPASVPAPLAGTRPSAAPPTEKTPQGEAASRRKMGVFSQDTTWVARLAAEAAMDALEVTPFRDSSTGPPSSLEDMAVLAVDSPIGEHGALLVSRVKNIAAAQPAATLIVLANRPGLETRLELIRLGVHLILRKPCTPAALLESLHLFASHEDRSNATVLIVDGDGTIPEAIRAELQQPGAAERGVPALHPVLLSDPKRFWQVLEETDPAVLLINHDLALAGGLDLCLAVRSDPHWLHLPVLFQTSRRDPETIRELFAAGADDCIHPPVVGADLVLRLCQRLEHSWLIHRLTRLDPLTRCWNRAQTTLRLARMLDTARRQEQGAVVALLDVEGMREVNLRHGTAHGDGMLRDLGALLRQDFPEPCVVGRWDGDQFMVGMFSTSRAEATHRVLQVADAFRTRFARELHSSLAEFRVDGSTVEALFRCAERSLVQPGPPEPLEAPDRQEGGSSGEFEMYQFAPDPGLEPIDTVLVDDDEALAALLEHALTTRGYSYLWFSDGESALEALGSPSRTVAARVILLDVSLPGRNGMAVLRQLVAQGVAPATRVIMLTARAQEAEVLEALTSGAFDHVAKPFSVPVLMQRIRRALLPAS